MDVLSLTLAAIADPTRRSILQRLAEGPARITDLARPFRISQQAVSKHVACLERARLVDKRRDGRAHLCSLRAQPLREVADWTGEYRRFWEESFDRLAAFLEDMQPREPDHGSEN